MACLLTILLFLLSPSVTPYTTAQSTESHNLCLGCADQVSGSLPRYGRLGGRLPVPPLYR